MASITTRAGKGSPLTNAELDANFTNINDGITTAAAITGGTITGVSINNSGIGSTTPSTGAFTSIVSTSPSGVLTRAAATQDGVQIVGRSGGTSSYEVTLTPTTLTADRTLTLPNLSGALLVDGGPLGTPSSGTVTNLTGTASININGTVGAATPNTGAFTTISATGDGTFSGTGQVKLPAGTTAQRSGSPATGMLRYNTSLSSFEGYDGTAWGGIGGAQAGGAIVTNKSVASVSYTIASGENGMSVGPVTINSGVTVTVSSGQRWLVL